MYLFIKLVKKFVNIVFWDWFILYFCVILYKYENNNESVIFDFCFVVVVFFGYDRCILLLRNLFFKFRIKGIFFNGILVFVVCFGI